MKHVGLKHINENNETALKEQISKLICEGYTLVFEPETFHELEGELLHPVKITISIRGQENVVATVQGMILDEVMTEIWNSTPEREEVISERS